MGRLLILTLAALIFLFAFSHARTLSDLPAKEVNGRDPAESKLPESELKPKPTTATLLLPSEKPDSEPATVVEREPAATNSKLPDSDGPTILTNEVSAEFKQSETVPARWTVTSLRPINRHFPSRRPFPLSFRRGHPCRHGRPHVGPWSPRFHGGERDRDVVSYGDDMILSSNNNLGFDPVFRDGAHQIPARFPFRHDDEMDLERPHHHHHHHCHHDRDRHEEFEERPHHHHHHNCHHDRDRHEEFESWEKPREHNHEHKHEDEHEHVRGLMWSIRKYLNHF